MSTQKLRTHLSFSLKATLSDCAGSLDRLEASGHTLHLTWRRGHPSPPPGIVLVQPSLNQFIHSMESNCSSAPRFSIPIGRRLGSQFAKRPAFCRIRGLWALFLDTGFIMFHLGWTLTLSYEKQIYSPNLPQTLLIFCLSLPHSYLLH